MYTDCMCTPRKIPEIARKSSYRIKEKSRVKGKHDRGRQLSESCFRTKVAATSGASTRRRMIKNRCMIMHGSPTEALNQTLFSRTDKFNFGASTVTSSRQHLDGWPESEPFSFFPVFFIRPYPPTALSRFPAISSSLAMA